MTAQTWGGRETPRQPRPGVRGETPRRHRPGRQGGRPHDDTDLGRGYTPHWQLDPRLLQHLRAGVCPPFRFVGLVAGWCLPIPEMRRPQP